MGKSVDSLVEYTIKMVRDQRHYAGEVTLGGCRFAFSLVLAATIPELDAVAADISSLNEVGRMFVLTVKKRGKDIQLMETEYGIFLSLLMPPLFEFFELVRNSKHNTFIGRTSQGAAIYTFSTEQCRWLSQPKFGCRLT